MKAARARPPQVQRPWNRARSVRVTREELYELVWSTQVVEAAKRYGLSDNGLRKKRSRFRELETLVIDQERCLSDLRM